MKSLNSLGRLCLTVAAMAMVGGVALAQNLQNPSMSTAPLPEMPDPLKNLSAEGAQIRYLGREYGFDAWLTVKNGQEQYFYVLPDRSAFLMGVLFDPQGKLVTVEQVSRLRQSGDDILEQMGESEFEKMRNKTPEEKYELLSSSEKLFYDIEQSNWVPIGRMGAPVVYAFVDPQCPHCHNLMTTLREGKYFQDGKIQVRLIPVGFRQETIAQAAYLIAAPDPQERWFRHMEGDPDALPAKAGINDQGVQRNMAIMQSWKFNVTPLIIYRALDGTVKIVQGQPADMDAMIEDIGQRG